MICGTLRIQIMWTDETLLGYKGAHPYQVYMDSGGWSPLRQNALRRSEDI